MLRITALTMEDVVISLNNTQTTQLAWLHNTTFGIPRPGPGRRNRIKIKICLSPEQIENVGYCLYNLFSQTEMSLLLRNVYCLNSNYL